MYDSALIFRKVKPVYAVCRDLTVLLVYILWVTRFLNHRTAIQVADLTYEELNYYKEAL